MRKTNTIDLIGKRFGRYIVAGDAGVNKRKDSMVNAVCDCGTEKIVRINTLISGQIKSCGCLRRDINSLIHATHKQSGTILFKRWVGMRKRCESETSPSFKNYKGRGIRVCQEWSDSFLAFRDFAISNGWNEKLEIDRIDNDGDYTPENVKFVTKKENINNARLLRSTNTTGFRGVYLDKETGMFTARGSVSGVDVLQKRGFKSAKGAALYRDEYYRSRGVVTPMNFPEVNQ